MPSIPNIANSTEPPSDASTAPASRNQKRDNSVKIRSSLSIPIGNISPAPAYSFLANLHVFAAALLSGFVNSKWLHSNRIPYKLRHNSTIPSSAKLPAIITRLSYLFAALSRDKKSFTGKKMSLKDGVQLTFQGLETRAIRPKPDTTGSSPTPQQQIQTPNPGPQPPNAMSPQNLNHLSEDVSVVMEARIHFSPPPQALKMIKENIDRDIAFHKNSGACSLRLRGKVGVPIISSLVERVVRVERLVSFIHILQTQGRAVQCQTISLGRITFTYGQAASTTDGDAMDIDGDHPKKHTAVVDFSASDNMMTLILERGNPHLEIIDHLTRILNGKEGLDGVAKLLPLTLPVLQGLDAIEMAWASVENGQAFVNVRAADWYIIRYDISLPASNGAASAPKTQKIMFEVRLRDRRSVPWWYINRIDLRDKQGDGIDAALKPIWDTIDGVGWQGMRVSGVAQPHGVEELLGKIDETLRGFMNSEGVIEALAPASAAAPAAAPAQSRAKAPVPPARQQQPTPNQSQNSQGRNNPLKREIVEID